MLTALEHTSGVAGRMSIRNISEKSTENPGYPPGTQRFLIQLPGTWAQDLSNPVIISMQGTLYKLNKQMGSLNDRCGVGVITWDQTDMRLYSENLCYKPVV